MSEVEVVDPICLGVKIIEKGRGGYCCCSYDAIPEHICNSVRGRLADTGGEKELVVTLGLFAIVRLERPCQIVVPCADFCIPEKDCSPHGEEDPCKLFKKMKFPINEFFPPSLNRMDFSDDLVERDEHKRPGHDKGGRKC